MFCLQYAFQEPTSKWNPLQMSQNSQRKLQESKPPISKDAENKLIKQTLSGEEIEMCFF